MRKSLILILLFIAVQSFSQFNNLKFIENKGQVYYTDGKPASEILFFADVNNIRIYIRKTGVSYVVIEQWDEESEEEQHGEEHEEYSIKNPQLMKPHHPENLYYWRVDMNWLNSNKEPEVIREEMYPAMTHYYTEKFPNGLMNIKSFRKITLKNVFKNIDVVFYSNGTNFKFDYVIKEKGSLRSIRFEYKGANDVVNKNDTLSIITPYAIIKDLLPVSYSLRQGDTTFHDLNFEKINGTTYGINSKSEIKAYDKLVVDPSVWITYLGGSNYEYGEDIEADKYGNVYVTGMAGSSDFPVTPGAFQTTFSSANGIAFLSKFSKSGTLLWSTYYGGTLSENSKGVKIDNVDNVYICGMTYSTDFPVSAGAFQTANVSNSSNDDAFVVKFDPNGTRLWGTYLGDSLSDQAWGLDVDQSNNIWISGNTQSAYFPMMNPTDNTLDQEDAFISQFDPSGNLLFSSFYGGTGYDAVYDLAVSPNGKIGITGYTTSTDLPLTGNAYVNVFPVGAFQVPFYAQFNSTGAQLYGTYLGGTGGDYGMDMEYDSQNNAIVTGVTASTDFPVTVGCFQSANGGGTMYDCFLAKFDATNTIDWATYYGNTYMEWGAQITTDEFDNIYLFSEWEDDNFVNLPVLGCAYQKQFGGTEDQYIQKFSPDCVPICFSYIGGPMEDDLDGAEGGIDYADGHIHTLTYTFGQYPVTSNAYQTVMTGFSALGVAKLCGIGCGDTSSTQANFTVTDSVCAGWPVQYNATSASCDTTVVTYQWSFPGGSPSSSTIKYPSVTYANPGSYTATLTAFSPCDTTSISFNNIITAYDCDTLPPIPVDTSSSALWAPNVFSPNGDGINDVFEMNYRNIKDFRCVVYNRWGTKLYEWNNVSGNWPGMNTKGKPYSDGVYFYMIEATGTDNRSFKFKGNVHLMRN